MMQRRSFLSLLLAGPLMPNLRKLEDLPIEPVIPLPYEDEDTIPNVEYVGGRIERMTEAFVMPMTTTDPVKPGSIDVVEVRPQFPFRPDRLIIPSLCAAFDLLHVSSNGEPQLDVSVPAAIFGELALGTPWACDVVMPGSRIVLAVRNLGPKPERFVAAWVGKKEVRFDN